MGAALDLARSSASWLCASPWRIALGILTTTLSYGIYKVLARRLMFRRLQFQGIPIMSHSLFLGHLLILRDFYKTHPRDINTSKMQSWLARNRHIYFPGVSPDTPEHLLPPMIYLDFYPLIPFPMAITLSPSLSSQLLMPHPEVGLPQGITRGPTQKRLFQPLTGQRDLFCMEGAEWKSWRGRMGWAFSHRNVSALVGEGMVEEGVVFARGLERMCGGQEADTEGWGPMFQMMARTSSLTMDVIARALLDIRLHDQTTPSGGAPAKKALIDTIRRFPAYFSYKEKFLRFFNLPSSNVATINKNQIVLDSFLNPGIDAVLTTSSPKDEKNGPTKERKTVVQQICAPFAENNNNHTNNSDEKIQKQKSGGNTSTSTTTTTTEILDRETRHTILGHLKVLMFAGHDTTATTLCWMYKELQDSPSSLSKLRAEHDAVFPYPSLPPSSSSSPDDDENKQDLISTVATYLTRIPSLLNNLPYTTSVIRETLRLHPPGPILRHHDADPSREYKLIHHPIDPRGSGTQGEEAPPQLFPTYGFAILDGHDHIQSCQEFFHRAGEFLPERWMPRGGADEEGADEYDVEPADAKYLRGFGLGPRSCIGSELAMAELKLAAALTIRMLDIREAWEEWDEQLERTEAEEAAKSGKSKKEPGKKLKPMLKGKRLYPTGIGPAHLKDDMPVQVRLARRRIVKE